MSRIEKAIRVYAFLHDVDYDTAAYRVMVDMIESVERVHSAAGLYDRMFGEDDAAQQD